MKSLNSYTESKISQLMDDCGAFFAFSNSQLDEARKEGVSYVSMGAGLICPKDKAPELHTRMGDIHGEARAQHLKDEGAEEIIKYELANHECYYTGDITDCVECVAPYGITAQQVLDVYNTERQTVEVW